MMLICISNDVIQKCLSIIQRQIMNESKYLSTSVFMKIQSSKNILSKQNMTKVLKRSIVGLCLCKSYLCRSFGKLCNRTLPSNAILLQSATAHFLRCVYTRHFSCDNFVARNCKAIYTMRNNRVSEVI